MKIIVLTLLFATLLAPPVSGATATAELNAYSLSINLSVATATLPGITLITFFTTYDGISGTALFNQVDGIPIFSGELAPDSIQPGLYRMDYVLSADVVSVGTAVVNFPTTDADKNATPDFLQVGLSGSADFHGSVIQEKPNAGPATPMSGRLTRSPGSSIGTYTATVQNSSGPISYAGKSYLVNAVGTLTYERSDQNSGIITVTVSNQDGTTNNYSATSSFTVANVNTVIFPEISLKGSNDRFILTKPFTLTRNGKRYLGALDVYDGGLSTTWPDYIHWRLDVIDNNDADGNGISDLTDNVVTLPMISNQPKDLTRNVGESATFSVVATSTVQMAYQWRKNGATIKGATISTYTIATVASEDFGTYTVDVSNSAGTTPSKGAVLTVNTVPLDGSKPIVLEDWNNWDLTKYRFFDSWQNVGAGAPSNSGVLSISGTATGSGGFDTTFDNTMDLTAFSNSPIRIRLRVDPSNNVGHISIGLFISGTSALYYYSVPIPHPVKSEYIDLFSTTLENPDGVFDGVRGYTPVTNRALLKPNLAKFSGWFVNGTYDTNDSRCRLTFQEITIEPAYIPGMAVIPASASPYLAGLPDGSAASKYPTYPADTAPLSSPILATVSIIPGSRLSIVSSGFTSHCGRNDWCDVFDGPDGSKIETEIFRHYGGAENGISDLTAPANCLIGVFLDGGSPAGKLAPEALNYGAELQRNYLETRPKLRQVFFIGDGTTSDGQLQYIVVPDKAERLYLGTWDSYGWRGNRGSFLAAISVFATNGGPLVDIALHAAVSVYGTAGKRYHVEFRDSPSAAQWLEMTNFVLQVSPTVVFDPTPAMKRERVYRARGE